MLDMIPTLGNDPEYSQVRMQQSIEASYAVLDIYQTCYERLQRSKLEMTRGGHALCLQQAALWYAGTESSM